MLFKEIAEIKRHIGYIYASTELDNLKTDIELEEREMKRLLGAETWALAQAYHDANGTALPESPTEWDTLLYDLLLKIQLPIALKAYHAYAPNSDLSHSEKGRQIFVSENEKPAFEWQLKRDEEATLNRAHRATDELLRWIDETCLEPTAFGDQGTIVAGKLYSYQGEMYYAGSTITEQNTFIDLLRGRKLHIIKRDGEATAYVADKDYEGREIVLFEGQHYYAITANTAQQPDESPAEWALCIFKQAYWWEYKQGSKWAENKSLFINHADDFDRIFPIEKSYSLFYRLVPFVRESQRRDILPLLGADRAAGLLDKVVKGTLGESDEDLLDFVRYALVFLTMHKAVRRLNTTLLPDALLRAYAESGNSSRGSAGKSIRDTASLALAQDAQGHVMALQAYLAKLTASETSADYVPDPIVPANSEDNNYFRV